MSPAPEPVGYYCNHSDEPLSARTHHDWDWDEEQGRRTYQHQPNTLTALAFADRKYMSVEERERRCSRAVPVYALDVPALLAAAESRGRAIGHVAGLREAAEMVDVDDDCACGGCDSCTSRLDAARIRAHADLLADALTGITAVAS